ncbi:MAG: shikimate dehydrogenase [Kineosporiaceae bacterium]|nr:shikimate dehydrogenase [Kineosporiaceae bacterium]MBK8076569.1 shikimate dehydrogenase [Kineosporiaceae bacterium]
MTAGRRAAVLGHPIAHSLSPLMHRAAYAALGLNTWTYESFDVDEPDLASFLATVDGGWAGLSLTMPLKRAVQPHLAGQSDLAAQVGAVNTVVVEGSGSSASAIRLQGYNTDVYGIIHALGEAGATAVEHAVVLGGGATAASSLAALRDLGCPVPVVLVRSRERAVPLLAAARRLGVAPELDSLDVATAARRLASLPPGAVVISTLPGQAGDALAEDLAGAVASTPAVPVLLDVRYDPWPTPLARAWLVAGGEVSGGFSMLVHQAEGQVRLMTRLRPPLDVMRAAGQLELDRRAASRGRAG